MSEEKFFIPEDIIREILETGMIAVGGKGKGKSNGVKVIVHELLKLPEIRVKIFDTVANWRFNFDPIPFVELGERTSTDVFGIKPFETMLYDVRFIDPFLRRMSMSNVIMNDFKLRGDEKIENKGELFNWIVYVLEEAQNVIGTYALSGKMGKFWLNFVSECRNYNQSFILIGQRLADISPKAIERCQGYLFFKATGDNDLKKIKKITNQKIVNKIKLLKIGEAIYWNGDKGESRKTPFPLFKSKNNPYPMVQKTKFWQKLLGW